MKNFKVAVMTMAVLTSSNGFASQSSGELSLDDEPSTAVPARPNTLSNVRPVGNSPNVIRAAANTPDTIRPIAPAQAPAQAVTAVVPGATLDGMIDAALTKVVNRIAGAKGRVAVMDFPSLEGHATNLSSYVSNKAGNKLIEVGRQVVDRATLEKVISEQKLQQNSLMDAATAARVGKLAGAGVFIIGNYTLLRSKFVLTIRALSVESGQFIPGAVAEETASPLLADMSAEIHELAGVTRSTASDVNLNGAESSDQASAKSEEATGDANELVFDKQVCDVINAGAPLLRIFKIAYDLNLITADQLKETGIQSSEKTDTTGETKSWGFTFGNWIMKAGAMHLDRTDLGKAIKNQVPDYPRIEAWAYMGSNEFPGKSSCVPHAGWWTEHRESLIPKKAKAAIKRK